MEKGKKKCLLILTRFPYPPIGGDKLKSYHLVLILSRVYDLNIIVITEEVINDELKVFFINNDIKYKVFTFKKYRFYLNTLLGLFSKRPLQVSYYSFRSVKKFIASDVINYDLVIANLIRTANYILDCDKNKYLDIVDSIALNYQRSINNVDSYFWKLIYRIETPRLLKFEKECVQSFRNTFYVNKNESEYWSNFGKTTWIPNGVNKKLLTYSTYNPKYKSGIAFFGKMDYQPNIDAVKWFVQNVLPSLKKEIKLYIVGTSPTTEIRKLSQLNNVIVTGFIEDPYEYLNSCKLIIAPMQTGAGIQNKILESMAIGKTVVTTSLGASPIIGSKNLEHLVVIDNPLEMSNYINDSSISELARIGENARDFIKKHYTWELYEKELIKIL